jgi:hypothetical protein
MTAGMISTASATTTLPVAATSTPGPELPSHFETGLLNMLQAFGESREPSPVATDFEIGAP